MNRNFFSAQHRPALSPENSPATAPSAASKITTERAEITPSELWLLRAFVILGTIVLCCVLKPFALHGFGAAATGLFLGVLVVFSEMRLRRAPIPSVVGGAAGALLGMLAALLCTLIVSQTTANQPTKFFLGVSHPSPSPILD